MARGLGVSRSFLLRQGRHNRRGFALAGALLALVLIDALIAGVLFAITEETRTGAVGASREVALNACESAIVLTITDREVRLPDSIGVRGAIDSHVAGLATDVIVYITRLDSTLYSIVAEAVPEPGTAGLSHRVGIIVRALIAADRSIAIDPISERPWFELF